jgi:hypothetical protein
MHRRDLRTVQSGGRVDRVQHGRRGCDAEQQGSHGSRAAAYRKAQGDRCVPGRQSEPGGQSVDPRDEGLSIDGCSGVRESTWQSDSSWSRGFSSRIGYRRHEAGQAGAVG